MKVLVLNCGSSSVKYQLIDSDQRISLATGIVSRIGMTGAVLTHRRYDGDEVKLSGEILDHQVAIEYVLSILLSKNHGVLKDRGEIDAVGHRVVHGGEKFTGSVLVTPDVLKMIRDCIDLAPLHNPHNLRGINGCLNLLPGTPQVAVFDTAFHSRMPSYAYIYGIPYVLYRRYGIRRYGFHGTSHFYVSGRAAELLGQPVESLKMVTCHLGNGCSITAVEGGVSVDTSMGLTPLEGLLMGTRCGDVDPAMILHIMGREELGLSEANTLLNKHSGLLGISGVSSDMRDILSEMASGNRRAQLAFDVFCYRLRKYIGAYAAVMGGLDAIVFTAGIGENSPEVRKKSCERLAYLGVHIDDEKNQRAVNTEAIISAESSSVAVLVIPTNEELVIALDTAMIVEKVGTEKTAAAVGLS